MNEKTRKIKRKKQMTLLKIVSAKTNGGEKQ
jgi:hypothetical protein